MDVGGWYFIYTGDCYAFKVILRSFGTFLIIDKFVSRKRLGVHEKVMKFDTLRY